MDMVPKNLVVFASHFDSFCRFLSQPLGLGLQILAPSRLPPLRHRPLPKVVCLHRDTRSCYIDHVLQYLVILFAATGAPHRTSIWRRLLPLFLQCTVAPFGCPKDTVTAFDPLLVRISMWTGKNTLLSMEGAAMVFHSHYPLHQRMPGSFLNKYLAGSKWKTVRPPQT